VPWHTSDALKPYLKAESSGFFLLRSKVPLPLLRFGTPPPAMDILYD